MSRIQPMSRIHRSKYPVETILVDTNAGVAKISYHEHYLPHSSPISLEIYQQAQEGGISAQAIYISDWTALVALYEALGNLIDKTNKKLDELGIEATEF